MANGNLLTGPSIVHAGKEHIVDLVNYCLDCGLRWCGESRERTLEAVVDFVNEFGDRISLLITPKSHFYFDNTATREDAFRIAPNWAFYEYEELFPSHQANFDDFETFIS
jgi:hypothetical protein